MAARRGPCLQTLLRPRPPGDSSSARRTAPAPDTQGQGHCQGPGRGFPTGALGMTLEVNGWPRALQPRGHRKKDRAHTAPGRSSHCPLWAPGGPRPSPAPQGRSQEGPLICAANPNDEGEREATTLAPDAPRGDLRLPQGAPLPRCWEQLWSCQGSPWACGGGGGTVLT